MWYLRSTTTKCPSYERINDFDTRKQQQQKCVIIRVSACVGQSVRHYRIMLNYKSILIDRLMNIFAIFLIEAFVFFLCCVIISGIWALVGRWFRSVRSHLVNASMRKIFPFRKILLVKAMNIAIRNFGYRLKVINRCRCCQRTVILFFFPYILVVLILNGSIHFACESSHRASTLRSKTRTRAHADREAVKRSE